MEKKKRKKEKRQKKKFEERYGKLKPDKIEEKMQEVIVPPKVDREKDTINFKKEARQMF
jgi:hypothetical protein